VCSTLAEARSSAKQSRSTDDPGTLRQVSG
jgi:hypothetical protein